MANLPVKIFTPDQLRAYFTSTTRHFFYEDCKQKREDFLPHSDGVKPSRIIDKQRPNEPDIVKEFRLLIWEPITKPTFSRVVSSLGKIRRSSDWAIVYPSDTFDKVVDGEELEEYCEKNFPYFGSITNYMFSVVLKQYLIDSNAVMLVAPLETEGLDPTDYVRPFSYLYNCCDVIDFKDQEYAILEIASGCTYYDNKGRLQRGKSFYVVNTMSIQRHDQIDNKNNFALVFDYQHNLNWLPAFKLGGVICNSEQNNFIYESRISGILPNLNEAIAEYTDLQAGKRLNIYPERWEFTQHECPKCKGTGLLVNPAWKDGDALDSSKIKCGNCHNGYIPSGPYSKLLIRPADIGQQSMPTPPAGYIEKDINIIKLMDESVDKHVYKALASINFQFLEETPLNQSGTAKEVDKEELNNTVHAIAEDLVALMDKIYKTIAYYRYASLYNKQEIDSMLPKIPVPEHFDLISSQYMQDEIKRARESKINPLLISKMEVEFAAKRFAQDAEINKVNKLVYTLDPLPGTTVDEKLAMSANKTITRENNIISDNLVWYIRRALFEDAEFDTWEYDEQMELMNKYAAEQIAGMDEAARLIAQALQGGDSGNVDTSNNADSAPMDEVNQNANANA
jgi:hypothetical protein